MTRHRATGGVMNLTTEYLSDYACRLVDEDLSPEVVHQVKRTLVDTVGCAAGAFDGEPPSIARRAASRIRGNLPARILGTTQRTSMDMAAFATTVLVRYLDCNDTYAARGTGHPGPAACRPSLPQPDSRGVGACGAPTVPPSIQQAKTTRHARGATTLSESSAKESLLPWPNLLTGFGRLCEIRKPDIMRLGSREANAMGKTISATEAARPFSDLLNRVGFRSERPGHSNGLISFRSTQEASSLGRRRHHLRHGIICDHARAQIAAYAVQRLTGAPPSGA
jgi:hypothetical protein